MDEGKDGLRTRQRNALAAKNAKNLAPLRVVALNCPLCKHANPKLPVQRSLLG